MTLPLTKRQEQLWRFIRSCERSPTYEEMAQALGYANRSSANALITTLMEKGYVRLIPGRARSVVAVDPHDDLTAFKTVDLIAELERRGIMLGIAA